MQGFEGERQDYCPFYAPFSPFIPFIPSARLCRFRSIAEKELAKVELFVFGGKDNRFF